MGQEDRGLFEFGLKQFGLGHFKPSQVNPQGLSEKNGKIAIVDNVTAIDEIKITVSNSRSMIVMTVEETERQAKREAEQYVGLAK